MCVQLENTPLRTVRAAPARKAPAPAWSRGRKRAPPVPAYRTNAQVSSLVASFEAATLPREEWTHASHLVVALDYARRFKPGEAFARFRDALKRYNKATASPETQTRGYHETITLAWFHLVRHFLEVFDDGRSIAALADALVEVFSSKNALFEHYSRERLMTAEARERWVEPDLRPLPELEPYTAEDRKWLEALDLRAAALATARPAVSR
ncbi:hypothetical protein HY251_11930, partial [bacterium]|nr:hypothetical protein [bacterium]